MRSSAVGIRRWFRPPGSVRGRMSCEKKKNSLLRPLLKLGARNQHRTAERPRRVVERVERRVALGGDAQAALLPAR